MAQVLRDRNLLDSVGGAALVTNLFTFVPTAANVQYYLEIVRDKYILRQIISAATESVRRAYEEQDEVDSLLDEVEQKIFDVGEDRFKGQMLSMKDHAMQAIETIEKLYERKGSITGISTGFVEFDRMTSGLHPSEMVVIAARPSMGKTALAMNIAEFVAINEKLPVGVFSLEMSSQQLVQRLLCSRARVNLQRVRDGFLGERDFPSLTAAASKLAEAKIFIDDSASLSILELRAKARRLKAQQDVSLIIVDYLQLLRSTSRRAQDNRQLEISEISAGLKALAKDLKIPVIVVAQLNRQPEQRTGGKPRLSDLRESGSIEQDADLVMFIFREEVYKQDDPDLQGRAEIIIAKQRNGPVGKIDLTSWRYQAAGMPGGARFFQCCTNPCARVPAAITPQSLTATLRVVSADLTARFGIARPRIAVCGLNPHAGEGGYLGREEIEVIAPVIEALRASGLDLVGPIPADTAFVPARARATAPRVRRPARLRAPPRQPRGPRLSLLGCPCPRCGRRSGRRSAARPRRDSAARSRTAARRGGRREAA